VHHKLQAFVKRLAVALTFTACGGDGDSKSVVAVPPPHTLDGGVDIDAGRTARDAASDATATTASEDANDIPLCGDSLCACADGIDNDSDGHIDLEDSDCSSPYQNDEQPYASHWGDHRYDDCQGCFFSTLPGSAEDGCRVPFSCVTSGVASGAGGSCSHCTASQDCQNFCLPLVPNGCDCFGCCAVHVAPGQVQLVLVDTDCDPNGDLRACKTCVLSTTCVNPCEGCEVCPGQDAADLPSRCSQPDAG